ncbi:MAG: hypothetical protein PHX78_02690 [bacterium]|nr:hypothetical protein [bacterium]
MSEEKKDKKKNKGPIAAIWESMTKSGGCCGTGETCGCSEKDSGKGTKEENKKGKK